MPRRAWSEETSSDHPERAAPTGLVEEMHHDVKNELDPFEKVFLQILEWRSLKGPVDEHRPANQVLFRNKSPVTTIEADVAIVAHGEESTVGHDEIVPLDVLAHGKRPLRSDVAVSVG